MLWELCKHLKKECPIYLEMMNEDEDHAPENYVVIQESTFDNSYAFADGKPELRQRTFSINIHCKTRSKIPALIASYRSVLYSNNIPFTQSGPIFEPNTGFITTAFTGSYIYGSD